MILNLPNVSLLGLNQSYRFLGAGFHYSNSKQLSIEGSLNDLTNLSGISGTWSGLYNVKSNPNFESIILNGFNFGAGRLLNASFPEGNDVQLKNYSLTVEVFETGNLYNLSNTYYQGIDVSNFQYLQDFEESYSFERKTNGGYGYNHNASIRFNSGVGDLSAIAAAKNLAKTLFTGKNLGFAFYSGFVAKAGKRFISETYNKITNECSFNEVFDFDSNYGNYSLTRTNSFNIDANGVVTATENGVIRGIETPTYQKAINALNSVKAQSYERVTGMVFDYDSSLTGILSTPIRQSNSLDIFGNNLSYELVYSSDSANSGSFFWNYEQQLTTSLGISVLTENGNIIGNGTNLINGYEKADGAFFAISNDAVLRASKFYESNSLPTGIFIQSKSESRSPTKGVIDYQFVFSNETPILGKNGIKRIDIVESNREPFYLYTEFGIFNQKTMIQDTYNATAGGKQMSLTMKGERGISLDSYLENAKDIINSGVPVGVNTRINAAEYSFDVNNAVVSVNVGWEYNKLIEENDWRA